MQTATRRAPSTAEPSDGSRTLTITNHPTEEEGSGDENSGQARPIGVLRLRAKRSGNRVAWGDDVVDNEGAGKKKSKICCIYHRPKRYDESSSDSSDSSDDEHGHSSHSHSHQHGHDHSHAQPHGQASSSSGQRCQTQIKIHTLDLSEDDEPNAYEQAPGNGKGKGKQRGCES